MRPRSPGGPLYVAASDRVPLADAVRLSVATAGRSLRIARRERQLHGYVPWLLVPMSALIGWLLQRWWLVLAGVVVDVLAVYLSVLLPCLLARAGVRGRALLYESTGQGRAVLTLQVRRRGFLWLGPRYLALWNLASMPDRGSHDGGRGQPQDRTARAGWLVMERAVGLACDAGLDLRFRATNRRLADAFYVPLGFAFECPEHLGAKPRMVLPVRASGVDDVGLRRLRELVGEAADELGVPRPAVTVVNGAMDGKSPNAHAAGAGRREARVEVNTPLTAADLGVQRWFAAHEVGHLRLGVTRPLRARLTGRVALGGYLAAAGVVWLVAALWSSWLGVAGPLLLLAALGGWLAYSQAEEYAADELAVRVLQAWGQDPLAGTRAVMDQTWFGPRGPGVMARSSTHPTAERRLARVEQVMERDAVRPT